MEQRFLVIGDLEMGYRLIGPFKNGLEAIAYVRDKGITEPWLIAEITEPHTDKD